MTASPSITLDRREVVTRILEGRGDTLVVSGLGSPTFDVFAAGDSPLNFYFWGGMGGTAVFGLGLALAQPARRVLVVTGDGEMLMGLGSLATIGVQQPKNLAIVVLDNESYGETGMQPTHTAAGIDLAGVAKAATFQATTTIYTRAELDAWRETLWKAAAPSLAVVKITASRPPLLFPLRDGTHIKNRFREALLGPQAFA
jgi:thiamine pyrophosphate-dependent acetolactate synthase large subunit-like protein